MQLAWFRSRWTHSTPPSLLTTITSHPGSQAMYCHASYTYKAWGCCWPTDWSLSAYSAVSSAVQRTKVLRGPIRTTEMRRWKNLCVLRADSFALRTSILNLSLWPYHSKNASYCPAILFILVHVKIVMTYLSGCSHKSVGWDLIFLLLNSMQHVFISLLYITYTVHLWS